MLKTAWSRAHGRLAAWRTKGSIDRWLLAGIVLLGLLIRLRTTADWNFHHPDSVARLNGDEPQYDSHARMILGGEAYDPPDRVPLYPVFLALARLLAHGSYSRIVYVQALLGLTVIPLTYILAGRLFGRGTFGRVTALLGALFVAVSYILIHQSLSLLSEILFTPVVLVVVVTLVDALRRPTGARMAWAGFWLGFSWLVHPTLLLFPLAAVLLFRAAVPRKRMMRLWAIYALAAVLTVTPWFVRNTVRYHAVFPLTTSNAFLYQASPEYYHYVRDLRWPYLRVWTDVIYGPRFRKHDPETISGDRWWEGRALQSIFHHPATYLRYALERVADYWIGDPNNDWVDSSWFNYNRLRAVNYGRTESLEIIGSRLLPIVALFSIMILWSRRRSLRTVYALLAFCTLFHAATHAEARLSDPLQPLLLILIAGGVVTVGRKVALLIRARVASVPRRRRSARTSVWRASRPHSSALVASQRWRNLQARRHGARTVTPAPAASRRLTGCQPKVGGSSVTS